MRENNGRAPDIARRVIANKLRSGSFFYAQVDKYGKTDNAQVGWFWDCDDLTAGQLMEVARIASDEAQRRNKLRK